MDRLVTMIAFFATIVLLSNVVSGQRKAVCTIIKGSGSGLVSGTIELSQPSAGALVTMKIALQGFNATGSKKHGFHVHAVPSLANKCVDALGHLNIDNTTHGAPNDTRQHRHTGDLGNVDIDTNGVVSTTMTDWLISLHDEPTSVIGKPFVVHELEDDLGRGGAPTSNTTGNAGARIGCCLIELSTTSANSASSISILSAGITLLLAFCSLIGRDVVN